MSRTVPVVSLLIAITGCFDGSSESPGPSTNGPDDVWLQDVGRAIAAGEYAPRKEGSTLRVANPAQRLHGRFDAAGPEVFGRDTAASATASDDPVRIALRAWGREESLFPVAPVVPVEGDCAASGAVDAAGECVRRVAYQHGSLTEWWAPPASG